MARKTFSPDRYNRTRMPPAAGVADDADLRPGRVGGSHAAFGAPGPKVDLAQVLDTWRDSMSVRESMSVGGGGSVTGSSQGDAPSGGGDARESVSLSDGTLISFTVAGA